jgi:V-type H+-transporting ATPase proteolipid subunit
MGCTSAIVFACFGAAYGTAKAGVGVSAMGVLRPDLIVKSMLLGPLWQATTRAVKKEFPRCASS